MIREELSRLFAREERHRRLLARLLLALGLSVIVFAVGTVLTWVFESGQKGGDIHGLADSAFFCAVQLLTVSELDPVDRIPVVRRFSPSERRRYAEATPAGVPRSCCRVGA